MYIMHDLDETIIDKTCGRRKNSDSISCPSCGDKTNFSLPDYEQLSQI